MDSVVHLLHRALAEAIATRRGDISAEPVTVAEIYQELVPYRSVRSDVGFEMNADYEHALLRLLSGEDALVRLEPEEARSHLARELATPNPDVTLFRRYAACDVWVTAPVGELPGLAAAESEDAWRTPGWLDDNALRGEAAGGPTYRPWTEPEPEPPIEASSAPAAGEAPPPAAGTLRPELPEVEPVWARATARPTPAPAAPQPEPPPAPPASPGVPAASPAAAAPRMEREMPAGAPTAGGAECAFCGGALPADRAIRYCPFCGVDQQLRPCARCGEVLEAGWRYCVSCGAPAPVGTP